jgi:hypothetical protein
MKVSLVAIVTMAAFSLLFTGCQKSDAGPDSGGLTGELYKVAETAPAEDFPLDPIPTPTPTPDPVVTPTPTPDPIPTPTPQPPVVLPEDPAIRKSGACSNQESISSCLKCEPPAPPPAPQLATKAQKLAKIMSLSCPIPNKSYPKGYVSPEANVIKSRLYACTEALYPETVMSPLQTATMNSLLDDRNASMRNRLFAGLWYQPHYSDDFELYFGLTGQEAAYAFCLGRSISGDLITTEYARVASDIVEYDRWKYDRAAQARWKAAQLQRRQLLSCLNKPGSAPVVSQPAPVPAPGVICDYRSYEGNFNQEAVDEITLNLQQGYKVAMETDKVCSLVTSAPSANTYQGKVKIAAYRCQ